MKLDPEIVEVVARALARQRIDLNSRHREPLTPDRYKASEDAGWPNFVPEANVALAAAAPLIEAAVLKNTMAPLEKDASYCPTCGRQHLRGERDALLVEATRLLADIEAQLLPAAQDNWLHTEWKNDLFPRVRSIVPRLRSATQAEGGEGEFNL